MNRDLKLTNKHKSDISMRVVILILSLSLVSYIFKMCGSDIFNKFITNELFIKISNFIDLTYVVNIAVYSMLGFFITYFAVAICSNKLLLKWWQFIIVFVLSVSMAILRDTYFGTITYLFDFIQYIFIPVLFGMVFYKVNILYSIMQALVLYFVFNGMLLVNTTLCDMNAIYYTSNLIAYILCFIEPYLFVVAYSIFVIKGEKINDKSNIYIKQEKRTND